MGLAIEKKMTALLHTFVQGKGEGGEGRREKTKEKREKKEARREKEVGQRNLR